MSTITDAQVEAAVEAWMVSNGRDVHAIMRDALEAALSVPVEQEPVAWEGIKPNGMTSDITRKKAKAVMWVHNGWTVRPLYDRPAPPAAVDEGMVRNSIHLLAADIRDREPKSSQSHKDAQTILEATRPRGGALSTNGGTNAR